MIELSMFGFRALWSPYFIFSTVIVIAIYVAMTRKSREINRGFEVTKTRQKVLFISGLLLFYLCLGGPLDLLGHLVFSAHMTQMSVAFIMSTPLMMYGIPARYYEAIMNTKIIGVFVSFITKPMIALFLFNGFFSFYHLPLIFDTVKQSVTFHTSFLILLTITSFAMWWPIFNKLTSRPQLEGIKKIGYIFANGVLLTPACALIIFASGNLYETYSNLDSWLQALALCVPTDVLASLQLTSTDFFQWLPLHEDQQLGGVIMKVMQELVYGSLIAYVFFGWFKLEKDSVEEPLYVKQLRESGGLK